jgi:hypothetical protein
VCGEGRGQDKLVWELLLLRLNLLAAEGWLENPHTQ